MNKFRSIVVLFVIIILTSMLSACSGDAMHETLRFVSSASYAETNQASLSALKMSPRVESCDMGSLQTLINTINGETNKETGKVDGFTIGAWLDAKSTTHNCIH